jgi:hypothetical protein
MFIAQRAERPEAPLERHVMRAIGNACSSRDPMNAAPRELKKVGTTIFAINMALLMELAFGIPPFVLRIALFDSFA